LGKFGKLKRFLKKVNLILRLHEEAERKFVDNMATKKVIFDSRYQEWVKPSDPFYSWLMVYLAPKSEFVPDAQVHQFVEQAYPILTKNKLTGKLNVKVGALLRVRADLNLTSEDGFPYLAGRYVSNNIVGYDQLKDAYLIDHRTVMDLNDLNHIIDLNRPKELMVPEVKTDPQLQVALKNWRASHYITPEHVVNCFKTKSAIFTDVDTGSSDKDKPIALLDGEVITFAGRIIQFYGENK